MGPLTSLNVLPDVPTRAQECVCVQEPRRSSTLGPVLPWGYSWVLLKTLSHGSGMWMEGGDPTVCEEHTRTRVAWLCVPWQ